MSSHGNHPQNLLVQKAQIIASSDVYLNISPENSDARFVGGCGMDKEGPVALRLVPKEILRPIRQENQVSAPLYF